jgi:tripartite-type tricarboxylate transporter receptor subunit TctC
MNPALKSHAKLALAVACAVLPPAGASAAYPERPVTIVVPFAPGGANDVVVRLIQAPLGDVLGQPIIVENRGGAGGSIGIGQVARARPDGYTLLMAASGFSVNPSLYAKVPYDPLHDFEQVAELCVFPIVYTVRPDLGVGTLAELIARARAHPGALNYSTPGIGTVPHLATELLKLDQRIDLVHVTYPGAARAAQAILTRTVEVASMSVAVVLPLIEGGMLKGLAVTSRERWPEMPAVPTIAEAGAPPRPTPGRGSWCRPARQRTSSSASRPRWSRSSIARTSATNSCTQAFALPDWGPGNFTTASFRKCRNGRT